MASLATYFDRINQELDKLEAQGIKTNPERREKIIARLLESPVEVIATENLNASVEQAANVIVVIAQKEEEFPLDDNRLVTAVTQSFNNASENPTPISDYVGYVRFLYSSSISRVISTVSAEDINLSDSAASSAASSRHGSARNFDELLTQALSQAALEQLSASMAEVAAQIDQSVLVDDNDADEAEERAKPAEAAKSIEDSVQEIIGAPGKSLAEKMAALNELRASLNSASDQQQDAYHKSTKVFLSQELKNINSAAELQQAYLLLAAIPDSYLNDLAGILYLYIKRLNHLLDKENSETAKLIECVKILIESNKSSKILASRDFHELLTNAAEKGLLGLLARQFPSIEGFVDLLTSKNNEELYTDLSLYFLKSSFANVFADHTNEYVGLLSANTKIQQSSRKRIYAIVSSNSAQVTEYSPKVLVCLLEQLQMKEIDELMAKFSQEVKSHRSILIALLQAKAQKVAAYSKSSRTEEEKQKAWNSLKAQVSSVSDSDPTIVLEAFNDIPEGSPRNRLGCALLQAKGATPAQLISVFGKISANSLKDAAKSLTRIPAVNLTKLDGNAAYTVFSALIEKKENEADNIAVITARLILNNEKQCLELDNEQLTALIQKARYTDDTELNICGENESIPSKTQKHTLKILPALLNNSVLAVYYIVYARDLWAKLEVPTKVNFAESLIGPAICTAGGDIPNQTVILLGADRVLDRLDKLVLNASREVVAAPVLTLCNALLEANAANKLQLNGLQYYSILRLISTYEPSSLDRTISKIKIVLQQQPSILLDIFAQLDTSSIDNKNVFKKLLAGFDQNILTQLCQTAFEQRDNRVSQFISFLFNEATSSAFETLKALIPQLLIMNDELRLDEKAYRNFFDLISDTELRNIDPKILIGIIKGANFDDYEKFAKLKLVTNPIIVGLLRDAINYSNISEDHAVFNGEMADKVIADSARLSSLHVLAQYPVYLFRRTFSSTWYSQISYDRRRVLLSSFVAKVGLAEALLFLKDNQQKLSYADHAHLLIELFNLARREHTSNDNYEQLVAMTRQLLEHKQAVDQLESQVINDLFNSLPEKALKAFIESVADANTVNEHIVRLALNSRFTTPNSKSKLSKKLSDEEQSRHAEQEMGQSADARKLLAAKENFENKFVGSKRLPRDLTILFLKDAWQEMSDTAYQALLAQICVISNTQDPLIEIMDNKEVLLKLFADPQLFDPANKVRDALLNLLNDSELSRDPNTNNVYKIRSELLKLLDDPELFYNANNIKDALVTLLDDRELFDDAQKIKDALTRLLNNPELFHNASENHDRKKNYLYKALFDVIRSLLASSLYTGTVHGEKVPKSPDLSVLDKIPDVQLIHFINGMVETYKGEKSRMATAVIINTRKKARPDEKAVPPALASLLTYLTIDALEMAGSKVSKYLGGRYMQITSLIQTIDRTKNSKLYPNFAKLFANKISELLTTDVGEQDLKKIAKFLAKNLQQEELYKFLEKKEEKVEKLKKEIKKYIKENLAEFYDKTPGASERVKLYNLSKLIPELVGKFLESSVEGRRAEFVNTYFLPNYQDIAAATDQDTFDQYVKKLSISERSELRAKALLDMNTSKNISNKVLAAIRKAKEVPEYNQNDVFEVNLDECLHYRTGGSNNLNDYNRLSDSHDLAPFIDSSPQLRIHAVNALQDNSLSVAHRGILTREIQEHWFTSTNTSGARTPSTFRETFNTAFRLHTDAASRDSIARTPQVHALLSDEQKAAVSWAHRVANIGNATFSETMGLLSSAYQNCPAQYQEELNAVLDNPLINTRLSPGQKAARAMFRVLPLWITSKVGVAQPVDLLAAPDVLIEPSRSSDTGTNVRRALGRRASGSGSRPTPAFETTSKTPTVISDHKVPVVSRRPQYGLHFGSTGLGNVATQMAEVSKSTAGPKL